MRARRSLATIGCVFAVLGAAISPGIAGPKYGPERPYDPLASAAWGEVFRKLEEEHKKKQRDQQLKTLNAVGGKTAKGTPFTADPNAKTGGLRGVKSELGFNQLKGAPPRFPDVGAKKEVIGVAVGLQKKDAPPRPRIGDSWITPKTTAAPTTNQTLYKPVTSLGVKPSVPGAPQQKR
jgi:hypothetical protein